MILSYRSSAEGCSSSPHRVYSYSVVDCYLFTTILFKQFFTKPMILLFTLLHPILMIVLMGTIFGSLIDVKATTGHTSYVEYLLPGLLVMTTLGSASLCGTTTLRDLNKGLTQRLKTMPNSTSCVFIARLLLEATRALIQGLGLVLGAIIVSSIERVSQYLIALFLIMPLAVFFCSIFMSLGVSLRDTEKVSVIGSALILPLLFASPAILPTHSMPTWLQKLSLINPMTYALEVVRDAISGDSNLLSAAILLFLSTSTAAVLVRYCTRKADGTNKLRRRHVR